MPLSVSSNAFLGMLKAKQETYFWEYLNVNSEDPIVTLKNIDSHDA